MWYKSDENSRIKNFFLLSTKIISCLNTDFQRQDKEINIFKLSYKQQ